MPACGPATAEGYTEGIRRAVYALAPYAEAVYVDAAHGKWLSYQNNLDGYTALIASLGITHLVAGFATNVANYQPLGVPCDEPDPSVDFGGALWARRNMCRSDDDPSALSDEERAALHPCCDDPCGVMHDWGWGNGEVT